MHDSVTQAQHLIGAKLRDSQRRRMGRVVGVDQTRELPALLIVWEGRAHADRVTLPVHELRALVVACTNTDNEEREAGVVSVTIPERVMHIGGR